MRPKYHIVVDIDFSGPQGNAHGVIAAVSDTLKQLGESREAIRAYHTAALSANYAKVLSESSKWVTLHDTSGRMPAA